MGALMTKTRVLIVEDEPIVALDLQSRLEKAGYQVVGRLDRGESAIQVAGELRPDLVLMDIYLKGELDGIEAAEKIQRNFNLPVIFLTAFSDSETLKRARITEPFGYILKPYNERELVSNIELALYKHSLERERKLDREAQVASETRLKAHQLELEQHIEQLRRTQVDLEETRALYLDLYNLAPVGYLLLSEHGLILKSNQTASNLLGLERGKLTQQGFGHFIQSEDQALFYQCFQQLFQTHAPQECEFRILRLDGSCFWVHMEVTPAREIGQLRTCRAILSDVTRRKQAETETLAVQNQLEATLNAIPDLLFELGLDGRYYDYRSPRNELLAASPEIFLGKTVSEILPVEAAEVILAGLQEAQEKGYSAGRQYELLLAPGKFWFELSISRKMQLPEQAPRFVVLSHDITNRKRAEIELQKLSQAVEQSAHAVIVTDIEGLIEYANPKFTETTGYSPAEVLGKTPRILQSGEHPPELYQELWQTIKSGKIWQGQMHNKRKDGRLYWEDVTIAPVYDSAGKMISFISIQQDVTARKLLEEAERDHRQLAEALLDTAIALNGTLELDDILDRILDNIGKLTDYDAAMVSILEESRVRKIRYHNNAQDFEARLPIGDLQATLINVPILREILKNKQPYLIPDIHQDPRWTVVDNPGMQRIHSLICVPIESRGKVVGVIDLLSGTPGFFTPLHTERIVAFASQAAVAIENAKLFEQSQRLSLIDPLTELNNMRYFNNFARLEFERTRRYKRTLSVAMADIDHFKKLNDTYGHKQGDLALCEIALRIKNTVRTVDIVARYGGDEFVILMPETELEEALQVAERVRLAISEHPIEKLEATSLVTISVGVAELGPTTENMDELINQADRLLYLTKLHGRNRVEGLKQPMGV
jgi:diguanylate cyclase (GGDEF)-like protein/PAS domain S-box-containing protein